MKQEEEADDRIIPKVGNPEFINDDGVLCVSVIIREPAMST